MTAALVRSLFALALLCGVGAAAATPHAIPHVLLVQNSGWMEPFYSDPASPFKPLVTELALAVAQPGDALVLAAFNQSQPNAPSPRALVSSTVDKGTRAAVTSALAGLDTARKPGGALADTDLGEAVGAAMTQALGGRDGIVWLVTNNRNSPNNDQATASRNREFYQLIHNGGKIRTALAFPLRMPVKGAHDSANGLMVYAFAIGESGARALESLLASGAVKRIITEPPARLKPLDRNTVRLVPRKVENAPGVTFAMGQNGVLRADVAPTANSPTAKIGWNIENTMYPYTIVNATLSARSKLGGENRAVTLGSTRVNALAPGKPQPLGSTLQLPVAQLPGKWSLAALKSAGSAYVLPGTIEVHLAEQKLALSAGFRERMTELFPGDPLPDIFTPPAQVQASTAVLPIEVRVHYGSGPLMAGGAGLLALLGAGLGAAYGWMRPRRALVTVEDEQRTMHARTGTVQPIYDKAGNEVARLKTTLFGHQLIDLREGAQVRLGR